MAKYGENGPGDHGTYCTTLNIYIKWKVSMAIDANSGTELPMNPAISLFVTERYY